MAPHTLCRSLGLLEYDLRGLNVNDELLNSMKKWDCLMPMQADKLRKKPLADRLHTMMILLERRGPSKWLLLVCVMLEMGYDTWALKTWRAVLDHINDLRVKGKPEAAINLWEVFVRRMSVALVVDQHPRQPASGKEGDVALSPLKGEMMTTALKIWSAVLDQAMLEKPHTDSLNMWKILANQVRIVLSRCEPNTAISSWEELTESMLTRLKRGERDAALRMYEYLVDIAPRKELKMWDVLVEMVPKVHASPQRELANDMRYVVVGVIEKLLNKSVRDKSEQDLVKHLLDRLMEQMSSLAEKQGEIDKDSLSTLVGLARRFPKPMFEELHRCVNKLHNDELVDMSDAAEMQAALPSGAWSTEAHQGSFEGMEADVSSAVTESDVLHIGTYPMKSQSSGLALVINNIHFNEAEGLNPRKGSEMDELALPRLLERRGFHVQLETNLGRDGLYDAIASFAHRPEHKNADAAVLAVLTHGVDEGLKGTDGGTLSINEVVDCFSNQNAPYLAGKPKWLLLLACRDVGVREGTATEPTRDPERYDDDQAYDSDAQPADLFITYATLMGHSAWRDPVKGSYIVQALKDVLSLNQEEGARKLSLFEIHMKVQEVITALCRQENQKQLQKKPEEREQLEQKLEVRTLGWTKKFYFKA